MSARIMQILAALARKSALQTLHTLCETQHQVSTHKLERYLDDIGDVLAGYAYTLRVEYDALQKSRNAALAELAALKGGMERQQLIIGSTYASTRGFGRLLYLGETHDIDGWLHTFRATDGARKHYSYDQLQDALEEFTAPPAQAIAWEEIDKAPKDAVILLGYMPHQRLEGSRRVYEGRWNNDQQTWTSVNGFLLFTDATHWQPLPAAPTPGASDGKDGE